MPEAESAPAAKRATPLRLLKVGGIAPFTATDYPGQLAAVVFVQGCPWRCGYCHNTHLQPRTREGAVSWAKVMSFLARRVGLIDAVVFSGGEPTSDPALATAIGDVRALGFKIGLHSAGTHPRRFERVLPLVDWVGFDVKAPFDDYEQVTRIRESGTFAQRSLEALLSSGIDYECRTTAHPSLLTDADLLKLAHALSSMGVKKHYLQIFRKQGSADAALNAVGTTGYPSGPTLDEMSRLFPTFDVRRG
ncbi:anaerobic ribonucleoside-triphosphate reductase activating protein [Trinickia sp. Y13]|uniref:anaerobic ribonucleoside-triphosphate reductase activating protein n=1 Tax=Trinickia sp. Y13 TaxID=2917807 RepID=UPI002406573F|nr:anaerobic ribonucleoside-triphosphate reductase activating protein [Trinickia sp. Y13]MDG0023801.1 anaerobic ribonucleoside-triphosphate reductase activating protein [Trinickia sp. Y13]